MGRTSHPCSRTARPRLIPLRRDSEEGDPRYYRFQTELDVGLVVEQTLLLTKAPADGVPWKYELVLSEPKTSHGRRSIDLDEETVAVLRAHRRHSPGCDTGCGRCDPHLLQLGRNAEGHRHGSWGDLREKPDGIELQPDRSSGPPRPQRRPGIQGIQGISGLQGIQGVQGPKGDKGDPGASDLYIARDTTGPGPVKLNDYTLGLTEAQRAHLDHLRAKNTPSPAENLEELEKDTRAGRTAKFDLRVAPDEKVAWSEAARVRGMSTSEWCARS